MGSNPYTPDITPPEFSLETEPAEGYFSHPKGAPKYRPATEDGSPFSNKYNWIRCPHFVSRTVRSIAGYTGFTTAIRTLELHSATGKIKDASCQIAVVTDNTHEQQDSIGVHASSTGVVSKAYLIAPVEDTEIDIIYPAAGGMRELTKNVLRFNQLRSSILIAGCKDTPADKVAIIGDELDLIDTVRFTKEADGSYRMYFHTTGTGLYTTVAGYSTTVQEIISNVDASTGVLPHKRTILLQPLNLDNNIDTFNQNDDSSMWGYYGITGGAAGYFTLDPFTKIPPASHTSAPAAVGEPVYFPARVVSCDQWFNALGAHPALLPSAEPYDAVNSAIEVSNGNPAVDGYSLKTVDLRADAVTMPYLSFDGAKLLTYQGLTGRTASYRTPAVRYKAATMIDGMAIIGNIDVDDKKVQTLREHNRIMWTPPFHLDEFTFGRSRDIGSNDGDEIVALESFQGRVFCLKTNNIYVLNPGNGFREEGRIAGVGLMSTHAYTKTPYGIVVANKKTISLLPAKETLSKVIENQYKAETFNNPIVGYTGVHDELIFIPNSYSTGTRIYRFSFKTKGWSIETYSDKMQFSNIMYDDNGGAVFSGLIDSGACSLSSNTDKVSCEANGGHWSANTQFGLYRFDEHATNKVQGDATLKTKEFVFEAPELKKYIQAIKMTYIATDNIIVKVYTDGVLHSEKVFKATSVKKNNTVRINAQCNAISFEFIQTATSATSDFTIDDILIEGWYNPRGEQ